MSGYQAWASATPRQLSLAVGCTATVAEFRIETNGVIVTVTQNTRTRSSLRLGLILGEFCGRLGETNGQPFLTPVNLSRQLK